MTVRQGGPIFPAGMPVCARTWRNYKLLLPGAVLVPGPRAPPRWSAAQALFKSHFSLDASLLTQENDFTAACTGDSTGVGPP
jgi:hypothetical protein